MLARTKHFVRAVDGVSFTVQKGEIFTLAGESGCGKTTTGKMIVRLISPTGGKIFFKGVEITALKNEAEDIKEEIADNISGSLRFVQPANEDWRRRWAPS